MVQGLEKIDLSDVTKGKGDAIKKGKAIKPKSRSPQLWAGDRGTPGGASRTVWNPVQHFGITVHNCGGISTPEVHSPGWCSNNRSK